jgi:hypothetical protein
LQENVLTFGDRLRILPRRSMAEISTSLGSRIF